MNESKIQRRLHAVGLLICLASLTLVGCSSLDDIKMPKPIDLAEWTGGAQKPDRVVAFWQTYALRTTDSGTPKRAFGGRLLFYKGESEKPIKIDGTVRFFIYDADQVVTNAADFKKLKPLQGYTFTPEKVAKSYTKGELGHSYSFLLPYDELGGPEMNIVVCARFDDQETGEFVFAEESRVLLHGVPKEKPVETRVAERTYPGKAVSYETPVDPSAAYRDASPTPRPQMEVETINVSPSFRERLKQTIEEQARESSTGSATASPIPMSGPMAQSPLQARYEQFARRAPTGPEARLAASGIRTQPSHGAPRPRPLATPIWNRSPATDKNPTVENTMPADELTISSRDYSQYSRLR